MVALILTVCVQGTGVDAGQVQSILERKCLGCHGPQLKKPEGDFTLQMGKIDAPHMKDLVKLVSSGNMPPHNSPTGRLTAQERESVLAWVAAGAPPPVAGVASAPAPVVEADVPETFSFWQHLVAMIGNFHLLLLHFPIVLVLAAAAVEVWGLWSQDRRAEFIARLCLCTAALFAVPVAVTGWFHASEGYGETQPQTLLLHRWLGTGIMVGLVALAGVEEWLIRKQGGGGLVRVPLIFVAAAVIIVTAHLGGMLTHGANFLSW